MLLVLSLLLVDANGDGSEVVANGSVGASEGCTSGDEEDGQWEEVKPRGGKGLAPRSVSDLTPSVPCFSVRSHLILGSVNCFYYSVRTGL